MMTLLLLYAYCIGIASSRKIERACYEDLAFRVLTGVNRHEESPHRFASLNVTAYRCRDTMSCFLSRIHHFR
jgi:transposase